MYTTKSYYVYILHCSDGTYYTGVTNNLERRFNEHSLRRNIGSYTYNRRPVKLVFQVEFYDVEKAIAYEKKIKKWSAIKKLALINGDFDSLPGLAKKKNFKKSERGK
ncbi:MAG: GIY-YIG nuclease family protein [Bacteroidetes bacterium]|nr:GIY-YIG nuclease family protein [Bacteroidota bacterium]